MFAYVVVRLGLRSIATTVALAAAVWLLAPLPLLLTNAAFMKRNRIFVALYAIGWRVKLLIVAVALSWFLRFPQPHLNDGCQNATDLVFSTVVVACTLG